jgi:hypothetical protein
MALFLAVTLAPLGLGSWRDNLVVAGAGTVAGLAVYVALANWLRIPELQEVFERITARFGRGSAA